MPGCPAVLAWLCLQGRANPHATVPLQKRNNHTSSPQYAGSLQKNVKVVLGENLLFFHVENNHSGNLN